MITQEELKKQLDYNPETGIFRWRKKFTYLTGLTGNIAGNMSGRNCYISINDRLYLAQRLAWLYVYGYLPEFVLHLNRDGYDNRINNLREGTKSLILSNRRKIRSGLKGVHLPKGRNKWVAKVQKNKRGYYCGTYDTEEEAHEAYCIMSRKLFGEFHNPD